MTSGWKHQPGSSPKPEKIVSQIESVLTEVYCTCELGSFDTLDTVPPRCVTVRNLSKTMELSACY